MKSSRRQADRSRMIPPAAAVLLLLGMALVIAGVAADMPTLPDDGSRRNQYAVAADDLYKSPLRLLLTPGGELLYVTCEGTNQVLVVDTESRVVVDSITVGRMPFGLVLSRNADKLYVSNRWDNDVSVVDLSSKQVETTIPVGDDPHSMAVSPDGTTLFVANLGTNDLSVVDVPGLREIKRLSMGMAPFDLALSPDGGTLYVSNQYSIPVPFRTAPIVELTVVDVTDQLVRERRRLPSTTIGQGVAVSPDGQFAAVALELPKNLIPETQIYQGWMVTYGVALSETRAGGRTAYLLLDEPNLYFADPYGIAFSPDGQFLYVSSSGADAMTVIDMQAVRDLLQVNNGRITISDELISIYARHLGLSDEYVSARIPTGYNPKDVVVSPDGRWVYVANRLDDQITVIDADAQRVAGTIDLGGPRIVTTLRKGAYLFNYASISFQKQLSCNTCHPEMGVDGLSYDIAVDGGMGRNLVDNLTLRGIAETAPFKWTGKNPNLQRQEGPRAAQLFFRTHGYTDDENEAIVQFIEAIPKTPNRYSDADDPLNEFQETGKEMYERAYDNMGRYIPKSNRCITCHPPPYGTDRLKHDVGSKSDHDWDGVFDSPHLTNIYQRPPHMHDGRCYSLEEIWTEFNPDDTHGVTNDMTKDQLNALIEYVKTF
ncbi:beta-propeller fold lactonase family protein [Candidatus Eisenbacteria bacterium]|uniref:Beta-propeller fold lactonase family protein n=1 Tax=Eiseniibacteriota bacterium TaxID=2212470 RepID=A0ABV6YL37_UNCEI